MGAVVLDMRRNPATVYENVDVGLARLYRDQARAAISDAAEWAEEAELSAIAVLALRRTFINDNIPGETDLEQTTDDYGCVFQSLTAAGEFYTPAIRTTSFETTNFVARALSADRLLTAIPANDDFVETIEDEFGCLIAGFLVSGGMYVAGPITAPSATLDQLIVSRFSAGRVNAEGIVGGLQGDDVYAVTTEDEYGCVGSGVLANGSPDFGPNTGFAPSTSLAALAELEMEDVDRIYARPDGVMRRAAWTYIPVYGESTSVGEGCQPAISLTQPYSSLTFTGGPKSGAGGLSGTKPLVEDNNGAAGGAGTTQGETPCSGMSNTLVEYVASRYGIAPASMIILSSSPGLGGQTVAQLAKGTANYTRFMAHVTAAKALAPGGNVVVPCWHFVCGANDAAALTSYADFLARTLQLAADVDADIRAITGQTLPVQMLLYQTSGAASGSAIEPIQLAQLAAAEQSALIELTSPWYDVPYAGDGFHVINTSSKIVGRRMGIHAGRYLFEGTGRPLKCLSAISRGATVRLRFSEPVVIDTTSLGPATQNGIRVVDTVGAIAITAMVIDKGDVVMTLANAPVGAWSARIALDYRGSGLNVGAGVTGHSSNIRAALSHTYYSGGARQSLLRWAPHQSVPGFSLETA